MLRLRSVRTRTTVAAVLVVAATLLVSALALWFVVRTTLIKGAETNADHRAEDIAAVIKDAGLPALGKPDDDKKPKDVVWQVFDKDGRIVQASQQLRERLPWNDDAVITLANGDFPYVTDTERAHNGKRKYRIVAAVSMESADEASAALLMPLLVGLPLLLFVVGGTTWAVASRALGPVERIREEVEQISASSLGRRVPVPYSEDEVARLAQTMNAMLNRLEQSRNRQQQFVSDASHELRSPLASIRQAAEVARAHPDAISKSELTEVALEEAVRMQALVDQLLALMRAGEGREHSPRADVDVDDFALSEAQRAIRRGLAVDTTGLSSGRVHGDAIALGQVVRNLVDNASRHAHARLRIAVSQDPRTVTLTVEDDGPGIPEADRQRVFERFVRLDEARDRDAGGSGLGLAIVREVVACHGGTVTVDSSPLGGARFVVRLPA